MAEEHEADKPPPGLTGNVDSFNMSALRAVSKACKMSNSLPSENKADHDYYSSFAGFRSVMDSCTSRVESVMAAICKHNAIKSGHGFSGSSAEDMLEFLQDFNDQMLEKANNSLDEASGIKSKMANSKLLVEVSQHGLARISGSWNKQMGSKDGARQNPVTPAQTVKLLAAKHVARPQLQFKDFVNNSNNCFVPRLTEKPHNKKPLSVLIEHSEDGSTEFYSHPYLFELDHFTTPDWLLEKTKPQEYPSSEKDRPLVYVDTKKGLQALVEELREEKYLGLDVEAHNYRSYLGITCLIQLSAATVGKDYVIDPFPIWADMPLLNEVLANPNCLKIMHGSGPGDIPWLQRDFSLYFVNVFDTYLAAKTLGFPRGCLSLKFLLGKYCEVHLDKKFQLADWRIRPLGPEMLEYAMDDVRHLSELFHKMKADLLSKGNANLNLLRSVYDASNDLCKFRYEKPSINNQTSYLESLNRSRASLNSRQVYAYKEMFNWRDKVARTEDESIAYVLPNHMLLKICTELPREMQGILACCNPVPPLVKQNLNQLHQIVLTARDKPLVAVASSSSDTPGGSANTTQDLFSGNSGDNFVENPLKCPLDLSHFDRSEVQAGLATLLDKNTRITPTTEIIIPAKSQPSIDVFLKSRKYASEHQKTKKPQPVLKVQATNSDLCQSFLSPFQRYQLLKPFMDSMKSGEEGADIERSDADRIKSIKDHFEALTSMTPADYGAEAEGDGDAVSEESSSESSDGEPLSLDAYDPDPGQVQKLRPTGNEGKKQGKKRKGGGGGSDASGPTAFKKPAFMQVDYSQYSGGSSKQSDTEFNPLQKVQGNSRGGGQGKQRQRYKPGGKSAHFKRK